MGEVLVFPIEKMAHYQESLFALRKNPNLVHSAATDPLMIQEDDLEFWMGFITNSYDFALQQVRKQNCTDIDSTILFSYWTIGERVLGELYAQLNLWGVQRNQETGELSLEVSYLRAAYLLRCLRVYNKALALDGDPDLKIGELYLWKIEEMHGLLFKEPLINGMLNEHLLSYSFLVNYKRGNN